MGYENQLVEKNLGIVCGTRHAKTFTKTFVDLDLSVLNKIS